MKTITHNLFAVCLSVLFVVAPLAPRANAASTSDKVATYAITGMVTRNCPVLVRAAVKRVKGVRAVEASLEKKTATVRFDGGQTSAAAILSVIKDKAGFKAKLIAVSSAR